MLEWSVRKGITTYRHRLYVDLQSPEKVSWRSVRRFSHMYSIEFPLPNLCERKRLLWYVTGYLHHDNEIYSFIDSYIILQISFVKIVIIKKKHLILSWFNRNPCQYESTNYSLSSNTCHDPVRWGITWRWFNIRLRKFLDDMIADISKSYYIMDIYMFLDPSCIWRRIFSNDMSDRRL